MARASPLLKPRPFVPDLSYDVDKAGLIAAVSANWDRSAVANGVPELSAARVVGTPLRSFIRGDATWTFIETLISRARIFGASAALPYRCDTPTTRQFMTMRLSPSSVAGSVHIEHDLVRQEHFVKRRSFREPPASAGSLEHLMERCSMCNRLTDRSGRQLDPDELPADATEVLVVYHVCPGCLAGTTGFRTH